MNTLQQRGLFISFEGSDGVGKSTQALRLKTYLEEKDGRDVLLIREPGGTALGESIRNLLQFSPEVGPICAESELLLFAASRAQLVRQRILPALEAGTHVLADRFFDSTSAYQGQGRSLGEIVETVNRIAVGPCVPDLTFLLDMDSRAALRRAVSEGGAADRMEQEENSFYEKVRRGYLQLAKDEPERFTLLDASQPKEDVARRIQHTLEERHGLSR